MIDARRTLIAVSLSLLLVAAAVVSVWLMASAGVFRPTEARLDPAPPSGLVAAAPGSPFSGGDAYTVSEPRDPFRPLIVAPPTTAPTDTTQPGETTTTVPGQTTTTSPSDSPDGIRVMLHEIRMEAGVRVAVVSVDGVSYTVGVGDTFAVHFKVVSLTETGGVFTFGDLAFTLAVGQSILK
jgi:hypothetical protein